MGVVAEIYADATRFAAWLETAAPGDSFLYAIAGGLDPEQPVVAAVAAARDQGTVVPVQGGVPGERRYQVQKTSGNRHATGQGKSALPRISPIFAATPEGRLFALLCDIADAGLACPSNSELARRLDWDEPQQVAYRLRRLTETAHLRVRRLGEERGAKRVITITETGLSTAAPASVRPQAPGGGRPSALAFAAGAAARGRACDPSDRGAA